MCGGSNTFKKGGFSKLEMDTHESLQKLGLTSTEADIYLALLKIGESSVVGLSKVTKVHRRTIYDNLNILVRKGLVTFKVRKGVKIFGVNDPTIFRVQLEEKRDILEKAFPTLDHFYKTDLSPPVITIYEGTEATKVLIEDLSRTKGDVYWVTGGLKYFKALKHSKHFFVSKLKKLKFKTIQIDLKGAKEFIGLFGEQEIRLMPKSFASNIGFIIYGDIVGLGLARESGEVTLIHVESKDFAKGYKNYFNAIWKVAKPYPK